MNFVVARIPHQARMTGTELLQCEHRSNVTGEKSPTSANAWDGQQITPTSRE